MPPHIRFTQDVILDEAFEIVRQEGLYALSARRVAKELGCSTQPVYDAYTSMQELQDAVIEKAKKYALDYFSSLEILVLLRLSCLWGCVIFNFRRKKKLCSSSSFWTD